MSRSAASDIFASEQYKLKQLQNVLKWELHSVELSHSTGRVENAKVDTVDCFIIAKQSCSEKTLSYYPSDYRFNVVRH